MERRRIEQSRIDKAIAEGTYEAPNKGAEDGMGSWARDTMRE